MQASCRRSAGYPLVSRLLPLLLLPLLASCSVSLIAPYDSRTEEMVTQIQGELSAFHQTLIYANKAPDCVYSRHMGFYRTIHADIANLRVRVGAIAKNAQTKDQVEALEAGVDRFFQIGGGIAGLIGSVAANVAIAAIDAGAAKKRRAMAGTEVSLDPFTGHYILPENFSKTK